MLGSTPPSAMVVLCKSLFSSSSFLIASRMCLGTILVFLLSLAAFPASSNTSAARYSSTAARQTGAPAPTLSVQWACLSSLPTLPTGNCSPALEDLETALDEVVLALPDFPPFPAIVIDYSSLPSKFEPPKINSWLIQPINLFCAASPARQFPPIKIPIYKLSLPTVVTLPQHRAAVFHTARLILI